MSKNKPSYKGIRIEVNEKGKMDAVETLHIDEGEAKHRRYTPTNKSLERVLKLRETKFKYKK